MQVGHKLFDNSGKRPLIFSAIPIRDSKTGDPVHDQRIIRNVDSRISEIGKALENFHRLDAVSVPELVEENHEGKPRYNSIYTRMLVRGIADYLHKDAVVNKVVVHIDGYVEFVKWLEETSSLGISNIIFVGGNTRHHRYPGPSVSEANIVARHLMERGKIKDITVGNICLPERRDEAKKMLLKTITGASFFTTQMLFDHTQISRLLIDYYSLCQSADIAPASIFLSFAPLKSTSDLNLLDFLGVDLPESTKEFILEGDNAKNSSSISIINALKVYADVISTTENEGINVPLGVNVEQLTKSNLSLSLKMLGQFEKIIDKDRTAAQNYASSLSTENI